MRTFFWGGAWWLNTISKAAAATPVSPPMHESPLPLPGGTTSGRTGRPCVCGSRQRAAVGYQGQVGTTPPDPNTLVNSSAKIQIAPWWRPLRRYGRGLSSKQQQAPPQPEQRPPRARSALCSNTFQQTGSCVRWW